MKQWKEHYRLLEQLVPNLDSLPPGERVVLAASGWQDLELHINHRDENGSVVTLCRWFEHPSGDCFPDGGMEIALNHAAREASPLSIQDAVYQEAGQVLPPSNKGLEDSLHQWLKTMNRLGFQPRKTSASLPSPALC